MESAVRSGDLKRVQELIQNGTEVNDRRRDMSLLILSIVKGYNDIALALLEAGADVHAKNIVGQLAIHWACSEGLEEVAIALIDRGSRLDKLDPAGNTPLMLGWGNTTISMRLLQIGASCKGLSEWQMNDLFVRACNSGDLLAAQTLLKNGCSGGILSRNTQELLLLSAFREGNFFVVLAVLKNGCCSVSILSREEKQNLLHHACREGDVSAVNILLHNGCSISSLTRKEKEDLLHHACREGDVSVVRILLRNGHSVAFLSREEKEELLHHACCEGDRFVVEAVIADGCNVNCVDPDGCTPLMDAAREGHEEVVRELILAGADLGIQGINRNTALHFAAIGNHIQCGILLVEGGASVRTNNKLFQAPLDIASEQFREAIEHSYSFTSRKALCIIGNAEGGKSTLIAALQAESNSYFGKMFNWFWRVSDHRKRTAGIETVLHCSQRYGEVLFFDFAGQEDYHGPHQMFLEALLSKPGVSMAILLVVKATEEQESILHQLHRWLSPVALMSATASPPQVIVIGSFLDKVASKQEATAKLNRCIEETRKDLAEKPLQFVGSCCLDCRQPQSEGTDQLCRFLQEIPIPEFRAIHTKYSLAWVLSQIRLSSLPQAVQLQEFSTWIQDNKDNLPRTMPPPEEVCQDLSAAGHTLYLARKTDPPKSWLVLDLPSILHNVYGTLFSHSKEIVNDFGLLHCQHLADLFPNLDLEMVQQLLISLEFCIPVDPSVLKVELSELTQSKEASGWLFFPALISAKPPPLTTECLSQQNVHYLCWQLRTSKKHSISARVLQTILLCLAAHFVVKHHLSEGVQQHCCSIWRNGITWRSKKGIDIAIHINNRVIQVVSASITSADKSCQYLTDIISDILFTVRRLSPKLAADSYFVHPPRAALYKDILTLSPQELFLVTDIRKSIKDREDYSLSLMDRNNPPTRVAVSDLWCTSSVDPLGNIAMIIWTQPEPNQPQAPTVPNQPQAPAVPNQPQAPTEANQPDVLSQILSQMVYECEGYLVLFRTYVSRKSAGKGRAVLEKVRFDPEAIEACYGRHPLNEEEAVQDGLIKWSGGDHPTWRVLLEAMEYAGIAQQHCQGLREELYQLLRKVPAEPSQPHSSAEPKQPELSSKLLQGAQTSS